ncbi:hypothetical protein CBL_12913 [Carabus blaptoides fortunei]
MVFIYGSSKGNFGVARGSRGVEDKKRAPMIQPLRFECVHKSLETYAVGEVKIHRRTPVPESSVVDIGVADIVRLNKVDIPVHPVREDLLAQQVFKNPAGRLERDPVYPRDAFVTLRLCHEKARAERNSHRALSHSYALVSYSGVSFPLEDCDDVPGQVGGGYNDLIRRGRQGDGCMPLGLLEKHAVPSRRSGVLGGKGLGEL